MIIVHDIITVSNSSVTSEASGYELVNAIDYESPWLTWRSTSTAPQTITLNYTGSIDCLTLIGTNFQNITIKTGGWFAGGWFDAGWFAGGEESSKVLGYLRMMDEYRGLLTFTSREGSIIFEIPNQSTLNSESYFTLGGIIIGNKTTLTRKPLAPVNKDLILPVSEINLQSGIPKKSALGDKNHIIRLSRKGCNIANLNELRDIKRIVGKHTPFVYYENMGETGKVFLVRRIEDFSYGKEGYNDYQDELILEEIA